MQINKVEVYGKMFDYIAQSLLLHKFEVPLQQKFQMAMTHATGTSRAIQKSGNVNSQISSTADVHKPTFSHLMTWAHIHKDSREPPILICLSPQVWLSFHIHKSSIAAETATGLHLFLDLEKTLFYQQCNACNVKNLKLTGHCMTTVHAPQ